MRFSADCAAGRTATLADPVAGGAVAGAGPPPATLADWKIVMAADSRPPAPAGAVACGSARGERVNGRMVPGMSARRVDAPGVACPGHGALGGAGAATSWPQHPGEP